jgi:hypothetical protein
LALAEAVRGGPPGGRTVVVSARVRPEGDVWPWEALGLFRLHPDAALVSGRILDDQRRVAAGGEVFGFGGILGCPDRGRPADDPGYFGLALKQKSVSAVHPGFFVADTTFLRQALDWLPAQATPGFLGAWLGAFAAGQGRRVAYSPLVSAVAGEGFVAGQPGTAAEEALFLRRHGALVPDHRWYPRPCSRRPGAAYQLKVDAD